MADNVIRHDVVKIDFDVDESGLSKVQKGLDGLKKTVSGNVDDGIDSLKKSIDGLGNSNGISKAKSDIDGLKKSVDGLGKANGFDKIKESVAEVGKETTKAKSFIEKMKSSFEKIKSVGFEKLKSGLSQVSAKLSEIGNKAAGAAYNGLKKVAGITFKALTAGITAAATAVGAMVTKSVQAYGNYEQLVGGMETLLGAKGAKNAEEYAKIVKKPVEQVSEEFQKLKENESLINSNARNAFKTAGMSANEYMETITSFSAALTNSLGGDTVEAAKLADVAIKDMADNANKIGTPMESVSIVYSGLARGIYSTFDNLKLGYSGTKESVKQMVNDAAKIDKSIKQNDLSYANLVKAIHTVQENMEITGTTSKEAFGTIQGSMNTFKAAWGNLLTDLVVGGDNLDQSIDNLIDSIIGFEDESGKRFGGIIANLKPAITKALSGVGTLIEELSPIIAEEFPKLVDELLPPLLKAATALVQGLIKALPNILKVIVDELPNIIKQLGQAIAEAFGIDTTIFDKVAGAIKEKASAIGKAIPLLIGAFAGFKGIKGIISVVSLFSKGGGGGGFSLFGGITKVFDKLAKTKTSTVLKAMLNLGIIVGALGTLLKIATVAFAGGIDFSEMIQVITLIGILGAVGTALAYFAGIVGKFSITTVLKGLANMAIVLVGIGALLFAATQVFKDGINFMEMFKVISLIGILGTFGTVLAVFAGIVGVIPVSTVALGLANMAIVLVGLGALLFAVTKVFKSGIDFSEMFQVISLIGILGTFGAVLAVFAGIVGMIPVPTVLLGLVNIGAVLVGLGALLLLMTKVFESGVNFAEILKVITLIGILGTVGAILTAFAGIVGLIPIPVVLAGLTNMGLVLGGITGLIVAFGALTQVEGFTEFLEKGGEVLTKIFNIIGKMVGSLVGGALEGISDSLPAIGENLNKFITAFQPALDMFTGIDIGGVGTFFQSLGSFMLQMSGNDILSKFTGGTDFAQLGTDLTTFIDGAKGFFESAATLPENGFTNATKLFDCLAGLKSLPKEGGIVDNFSGVVDYSKIASGLGSLAGDDVKNFFTMVGGLTQASFDSATQLFNCLAGLKSLPKNGGIVGWFCGDIDYSKIANGLSWLSNAGVKRFFSMTENLSQASFDNATKLFECLAGMSGLAKGDSLWERMKDSWFGDDGSMLEKIATDLGSFAEKTQGFFNLVNSLNLSNLNGLWDSFAKAKTATTDLSSFSTVSTESLTKLIKKISELAKAFQTGFNSITDTVKKGSAAVVGETEKMASGMVSAVDSASGALVSAISSMWAEAEKASVAGANAVIASANDVLSQLDSKSKLDTVSVSGTSYAHGTNGHKGGNALVNDGNGAELVQMPNGNTFIPRGRNVLIPNAPKGMKVLSAENTARLMGRNSPTYRYANGTGDFDVWDYIDDAKGLTEKIENAVTYGGAKGFVLDVGKGVVNKITGSMTPWLKKQFDENGAMGLGNYVASKGVSQWKSTVIRALKLEGEYSAANVKRTLFQMQTESGGNPKAINLWDSNAKKGIPSKGLMQVIAPTFKAYARKGLDKNIYDPLSNITAAIRYAKSRYGSLAKAYQGHGYANGGIATKPSIFGEDGAEMAIPLSKNKRQRSLNLWERTGEMLGAYSPSKDAEMNSNTTVKNNTYSPVFNLTISGTSDDRATARKVKQWIAEALDEAFDTMARKSKRIQEI